MKRKKSISYEEGLHERLKDPSYAADYLNAHLIDDDEIAIEAFLLALRDVAVANGIAKISKKAALGRESLYKALSKTGNPKVATLAVLLKTMGLKLTVEPNSPKTKKAS
jgi:probable addiction module antidote protein